MSLILDLIFPKRCVGCGSMGSYFCPKCLKTVQLRDQKCSECDFLAIDGLTHVKCLKKDGLYGLTTLFENKLAVKKAIKLLKYRFVTDIVESLVSLIPQKELDVIKLNNKNSVIYPIPLHKDRLKWRGFNQAEKMAVILAKKLNLPIADNLLIRRVKRTPQAEILSKAQRIKNAQGLFTPNLRALQSYRLNVLLFDDVWTTGATIKEAAKTLKKNGVEKIWAVTLAR
jgi:ComF family protein